MTDIPGEPTGASDDQASMFDALAAQITPAPEDDQGSGVPRHETLAEKARRAINTDSRRGRNEPPPVTKPAKKAPVREPASKPGEFVEPMMQLYAVAGMTLAAVDRDMVCAPAIMANGEACARAWDELAQKNPAVRRMLRTLTQGSAIGALVAAHMPIVMAIMSQHQPNAIPAPLRPFMGVPEPEPEPDYPDAPPSEDRHVANETRSAQGS